MNFKLCTNCKHFVNETHLVESVDNYVYDEDNKLNGVKPVIKEVQSYCKLHNDIYTKWKKSLKTAPNPQTEESPDCDDFDILDELKKLYVINNAIDEVLKIMKVEL